jgi:serine/threonine protein kinase
VKVLTSGSRRRRVRTDRLRPRAVAYGHRDAPGDAPRHRGLHESRAGSWQVVDKRMDIWAFGCALHEMLTGLAPLRAARPPTRSPHPNANRLARFTGSQSGGTSTAPHDAWTRISYAASETLATGSSWRTPIWRNLGVLAPVSREVRSRRAALVGSAALHWRSVGHRLHWLLMRLPPRLTRLTSDPLRYQSCSTPTGCESYAHSGAVCRIFCRPRMAPAPRNGQRE